ncbi:hypothetical protein KRZ98_09875 [Sphingobium sp. AS12]|uniref:hypothetical protein n=1 Tax=Sphingobium sp. AS12 TaxID=2849495 RepID=UPI001C31D77B|nr:hypothetical protein [Sphingobium sp. AS12]MBV2148592.1 hypothetical protein [Sphingobium sp. AS12]
MTITVIHGPMRSGKTFHRDAFAAHYRCTRIVDDWLPQRPFRQAMPDDDSLVLTTASTAEIEKAMKRTPTRDAVRIVDIYTARLAIGLPEFAPPIDVDPEARRITPEDVQTVESRWALAQAIAEETRAPAEAGEGLFPLIHILAQLLAEELRIRIVGTPE